VDVCANALLVIRYYLIIIQIAGTHPIGFYVFSLKNKFVMIDESIQQYFIKGELGRGGMATVYLAHDQKFDTKVAIKVLNKEFVNNENIRKRFLAEARNMYRMSHPNIIKVTDLIDENDTVAFVMEHIAGETLKEYLERKGRLSDTEIKGLFTQMLDAVGYVHEQNLVHRDIKPSNFMLDRKGRVKLMDFGIAKTMDATAAEYTQTGTGLQMGTPMYMSPEQITETKSVTAQSDIYSLGVVLWQMVMNRKPYDIKMLSTFQLQNYIVNDALPDSRYPWSDVIAKATAKERVARFREVKVFKDDVELLSMHFAQANEITTIEQNRIENPRNAIVSAHETMGFSSQRNSIRAFVLTIYISFTLIALILFALDFEILTKKIKWLYSVRESIVRLILFFPVIFFQPLIFVARKFGMQIPDGL
jgi:serine/threonine protein kinase